MESPSQYEDHFTAFIDFLGFADTSTGSDEASRMKILDLLLSLSALRGDFELRTQSHDSGQTNSIRPAISTFSDHIVISFPIAPVRDLHSDEQTGAFLIVNQFVTLLQSIVASALRIGFLIRGGATIGRLYHTSGVVFGEAMVEAYRIESTVSVYPRIVLSQRITRRPAWKHNANVVLDQDGLYCFDYFRTLILHSAPPGEGYSAGVRAWLSDAVAVISNKLLDLEAKGQLKEIAKWEWFAREFRRGVESLNPQLLTAFGLSPSDINWWPERKQPTTSLLNFQDTPK